jgi:hypothetical protein
MAPPPVPPPVDDIIRRHSETVRQVLISIPAERRQQVNGLWAVLRASLQEQAAYISQLRSENALVESTSERLRAELELLTGTAGASTLDPNAPPFNPTASRVRPSTSESLSAYRAREDHSAAEQAAEVASVSATTSLIRQLPPLWLRNKLDGWRAKRPSSTGLPCWESDNQPGHRNGMYVKLNLRNTDWPAGTGMTGKLGSNAQAWAHQFAVVAAGFGDQLALTTREGGRDATHHVSSVQIKFPSAVADVSSRLATSAGTLGALTPITLSSSRLRKTSFGRRVRVEEFYSALTALSFTHAHTGQLGGK